MVEARERERGEEEKEIYRRDVSPLEISYNFGSRAAHVSWKMFGTPAALRDHPRWHNPVIRKTGGVGVDSLRNDDFLDDNWHNFHT